MIRINLIGRKVKQKKSHGSYQVLIYLALLGAACVVLFLWHQSVNDELEGSKKRAREAAEKVENLMRVKQMWEAWQAEKADLDRQTAVFNALQADQIGPAMALQYLSYALTRLTDEAAQGEEAREQELAAWNPKWDPSRIWLRSIEIKNGVAEFKGEAIDHEDVAEFYRRLESSSLFKNIAPGTQRRRIHEELQIKFVEFLVRAEVSFVESALAWRDAEDRAARQAAEQQLAAQAVVDQAAGDARAASAGSEADSDAAVEPGAEAAAVPGAEPAAQPAAEPQAQATPEGAQQPADKGTSE